MKSEEAILDFLTIKTLKLRRVKGIEKGTRDQIEEKIRASFYQKDENLLKEMKEEKDEVIKLKLYDDYVSQRYIRELRPASTLVSAPRMTASEILGAVNKTWDESDGESSDDNKKRKKQSLKKN